MQFIAEGQQTSPKVPLSLWLAVGGAITYGSLIPFEFRHDDLAHALARFNEIPWLNLGAGSRADWIANLLIYIPFAYLGMAALAPRIGKIFAAVSVALISAILATGIEFLQLFFPPRTVSLNDLLAEALGTAAGIGLWVIGHRRLHEALANVRRPGNEALLAFLWLYLIAYLLLGAFPFDFVVSLSELRSKLNSDLVAPLITDAYCGNALRCGSRLLLEIGTAVPIGLLVRYLVRGGVRPMALSAATALLVGLATEFIQLFIGSGITQGISVITRSFGIILGAWILHRRALTNGFGINLEQHLNDLRRWSYFLFPAYLVFLLFLVGNWRLTKLPPSQAWQRLEEVHWAPFYYHYFTSEVVAVVSLISHFMAYAPLGVFVWLWSNTKTAYHRRQRTPLIGAVTAAGTAVFMETSKLFNPELRPDPTNILIAAVGAFVAVVLCSWLWARTARSNNATTSQAAVASPRRPRPIPRPRTDRIPKPIDLVFKPGKFYRTAAPIILTAAVVTAWTQPGIGAWLVLALAAYIAVLLRYPSAWLIILPSVLAVANFAPWTGQFFFDESDAFVLATLGVFFWQGPALAVLRRKDSLNIAFLLLCGAYAVSALLMVLPPAPIDLNSFTHYYSPYNALRVSKSLLWALLLWPALHAASARGTNVPASFTTGVLVALFGVALVVLWERWAFTGLFNFASEHRVTGSFASMHTGGATIDGFLALAIPLITLTVYRRAPWPLLSVPLAGMAVYAALVTYSRGTYAALVVAALVLLVFWVFRRASNPRLGTLLVSIGLLAVVIGLTLTVLQGRFIQSRFTTVSQDAGIRLDHWQDALSMMDQKLSTTLLGMGPGSFPITYFWRNDDGVVPATYWIKEDQSTPYLSTHLGDSMYLDQRLNFDPYARLEITVRFRSEKPGVYPTIALCEKALLYSYRCGWYRLKGRPVTDWQVVSQNVTPGNRAKPWDLERTRVLSVILSGKPSRIDFDLISLRDGSGTELVRNSDFDNGMDSWYFAVDNHLPWHIKNIFVSQYFDTGVIGSLALMFLLGVVVVRQLRKTLNGSIAAPVYLAALAGFMTVGVIDSLFDDPRLGLIFWLFVFATTDRALNTEPH